MTMAGDVPSSNGSYSYYTDDGNADDGNADDAGNYSYYSYYSDDAPDAPPAPFTIPAVDGGDASGSYYSDFSKSASSINDSSGSYEYYTSSGGESLPRTDSRPVTDVSSVHTPQSAPTFARQSVRFAESLGLSSDGLNRADASSRTGTTQHTGTINRDSRTSRTGTTRRSGLSGLTGTTSRSGITGLTGTTSRSGITGLTGTTRRSSRTGTTKRSSRIHDTDATSHSGISEYIDTTSRSGLTGPTGTTSRGGLTGPTDATSRSGRTTRSSRTGLTSRTAATSYNDRTRHTETTALSSLYALTDEDSERTYPTVPSRSSRVQRLKELSGSSRRYGETTTGTAPTGYAETPHYTLPMELRNDSRSDSTSRFGRSKYPYNTNANSSRSRQEGPSDHRHINSTTRKASIVPESSSRDSAQAAQAQKIDDLDQVLRGLHSQVAVLSEQVKRGNKETADNEQERYSDINNVKSKEQQHMPNGKQPGPAVVQTATHPGPQKFIYGGQAIPNNPKSTIVYIYRPPHVAHYTSAHCTPMPNCQRRWTPNYRGFTPMPVATRGMPMVTPCPWYRAPATCYLRSYAPPMRCR
eukprot:GEMP01037353.1.p1 GENE.GEMP01037353.1~~GEMP01037353.1.p1  ORF type:complete len:581 (+),score=90.21 GEMP01037353.1:114-1856(+)